MRSATENNSFNEDFFQRTKYFLIPYIIFLITGAVPLVLYTDSSITLWINENHYSALDFFFKYATFLGDGIFYGIILIPLLFISVRWSITGLLAYSFSGLVAQAIKHIFAMPRPKAFFDYIDLNFVENVTMYSNYSFPSGHTTSAFSLFLLLAFITKKPSFSILFILLAIIVGISRVYLFQHFYSDIYAGSIIGVLFTYLVILIMQKATTQRDNHWLNNSITKSFSKK